MPMFETTSGLFITYTKSEHIKGNKYKPIDANLRLLMADNDFKDYRLQETFRTQLEQIYCMQTINMINAKRYESFLCKKWWTMIT